MIEILNERVNNRPILLAGIFFINFFAKISDCILINYVTVAFCVQWIYDIVLTVEVVVFLIYKKLQ